MILIVSSPEDHGHVRPVGDELRRRGTEFAEYDPASYPYSSIVTIEQSSRGVRWHLSWAGGDLSFEDVDAIWYRRPRDFELSPRLRPAESSWLRMECSHVFGALWECSAALWVSQPSSIRRASLKLLQLDLARALGFTVPDFVLTNDVDVARNFLSSCRQGAVVKALADPAILDDGRAGAIYTHLLSPQDVEMIDAVRFGPTFLQAFVPKRLDVRVTVVGDRVFAVGIESTALDEGRIDFRRAEIFDLPHRMIDLPEGVSAACRDLVSRRGLAFGAIDLLPSEAGEYVFLEINPNGQWYWIEQVTGAPLTAALCDLLTGVAGRRP
jgi:glutathione synthase/RimK-type ligase-like ATP-grasp enzyme